MSHSTIARRYAQALYEEAVSQQCVEQVDADIVQIHEALDGSHDLVRFFESPVIPRHKKEAVVEALFARRIEPTTLNFMRLLVEKQREELFPDMVRAYRALRDEHLGVVEARAKVAFPLSPPEEAQLVEALERLSGARIRLKVEHDPTLLGGLVVRIGDTVYDGSVRHQLASLREKMGLGVYTGNGAKAN